MNLLVALQIGLREIASHKFRSFLSMLGIVLGVSSLISTLALTTGIERGTRAFMQQVGGLEYVNVVNKEISSAKFEFWNLSPGRTLRDAVAIKASAPLVSHVSPELAFGGVISANGHSDRKQVRGVFPDHFVVARHELKAGRFLSDLDVERGLRSAVIGDEIASILWHDLPARDIVGRQIRINDRPFEVVGVLPKYERDEDKRRRESGKAASPGRKSSRWDAFRQKNESILIPYSTMFFDFRAGAFPMDSMDSVRLDNLTLRIGDIEKFRPALDQVRAALEVTHRGVDDFDLDTREEWFDRMESSIRATKLSGGLIATISLVVGGIGIMNIMLASISERVREIGIRLAVGARGQDIFVQIIVESVSIAFIGGLLGVLAAVGLIEILKLLAPNENAPIMTIGGIVFSVGFAVLAGLLSGIYPALRASRLNPISALRYE
ncbi:MAG: ABC transporter permease [Terrimicrobiaceae bacterium]